MINTVPYYTLTYDSCPRSDFMSVAFLPLSFHPWPQRDKCLGFGIGNYPSLDVNTWSAAPATSII